MVDNVNSDEKVLKTPITSVKGLFDLFAEMYGNENALFKVRVENLDTPNSVRTVHTVYMQRKIDGKDEVMDIMNVHLLIPVLFDGLDLEVGMNLLNAFYDQLGIWKEKMFLASLERLVVNALPVKSEDEKVSETEEEFNKQLEELLNKMEKANKDVKTKETKE